MALTIREQVLAAMLTALEGITELTGDDGVFGLKVYRNPDFEITDAYALALVDGDENASEENFQGVCDCQMEVQVEGHVRLDGDSATNIGTELNTFYGKVEKALLADRTLGGKAINILKTGCIIDVNMGTGQTPQGAFAAQYLVHYWHRSGDPFTASA